MLICRIQCGKMKCWRQQRQPNCPPTKFGSKKHTMDCGKNGKPERQYENMAKRKKTKKKYEEILIDVDKSGERGCGMLYKICLALPNKCNIS